MPIAIDATIGGAAANSYNLESELDTLADELLPAPLPWLVASVDDRRRAMVAATRRLDQERFPRERVDGVQALEWPRAWVPKIEQYLYNGIELGYYLTTEIPPAVKRAQALLAFYLVAQNALGIDPFSVPDLVGVRSENLGGELQTEYEPGGTSQTDGAQFLAYTIRPILAQARLVYAVQPRVVRG